METLNDITVKAVKAYSKANSKGKELLEQLFGKQVFMRKITDRIKTVEDALRECSYCISDFNERLEHDTPDEIAYKIAKVIARALNEGWVPDWNNQNEAKYYPWFRMSGGGFSYGGCRFGGSGSGVGSRLCFRTKELAEYASTQFRDIYKDFFTL